LSIPSLVALLLTLTGLLAYFNYKVLRLPFSVGGMGTSMAVSLLLIGATRLGLPLHGWASATVAHIDFSSALLDGMLSFLLFAGALHVDLNELREHKLTVVVLATLGVLLSTALAGFSTWGVFHWLGLGTSLLACLTFGALISPTDPVAVLGLLKQMDVPASLSTKIAGESLFNDGVGIVVFTVMFDLWSGGASAFAWQHIAILLLREVAGGLAIGVLLGAACFAMLRTIDNFQVTLMLTLSLVSGGYELASQLHTSGPLAIVMAGLIIGNFGRNHAMSLRTRESLDLFWETLDEILNGVLFVLMGLEVLLLDLKPGYVLAAMLTIPLILAARLISLYLPVTAVRVLKQGSSPVSILTWGGLRGGISFALALTLPPSPVRNLILVATYAVVAFSILVQAPTMPWLLRRTLAQAKA
jgi:CPA1 family monovalent cation:H+ antiporter